MGGICSKDEDQSDNAPATDSLENENVFAKDDAASKVHVITEHSEKQNNLLFQDINDENVCTTRLETKRKDTISTEPLKEDVIMVGALPMSSQIDLPTKLPRHIDCNVPHNVEVLQKTAGSGDEISTSCEIIQDEQFIQAESKCQHTALVPESSGCQLKEDVPYYPLDGTQYGEVVPSELPPMKSGSGKFVNSRGNGEKMKSWGQECNDRSTWHKTDDGDEAVRTNRLRSSDPNSFNNTKDVTVVRNGNLECNVGNRSSSLMRHLPPMNSLSSATSEEEIVSSPITISQFWLPRRHRTPCSVRSSPYGGSDVEELNEAVDLQWLPEESIEKGANKSLEVPQSNAIDLDALNTTKVESQQYGRLVYEHQLIRISIEE